LEAEAEASARDSAAAEAFKTANATVLALTVDNVTIDNKDAVNGVLTAYSALSAGAKALLTGEKALLDSLVAKIAALEAEAEASARDSAAAEAFKTANATVLALTVDSVAIGDKDAVNSVLAAYSGLSAEVKALLAGEKALLDSLTAKIAVLEEAAIIYHVTIAESTGGTVSADLSDGTAGTTITLSNTPDNHYTFKRYEVDGVSIEGDSFLLPAHNVEVKAVFESTVYQVNTPNITGGTVSADPASGTVNTRITLSNTPDNNYIFEYYTVNGEPIEGDYFDIEADASVGAVFTFDPDPNTGIPIGNPSLRMYLDGGTVPLEADGRTSIDYGQGTYIVSIAEGTYTSIVWYLNGNKAAEGADKTSLTLSRRSGGTYRITVEATPAAGVKNTGAHTFVIE
jgi:hypothetical protein